MFKQSKIYFYGAIQFRYFSFGRKNIIEVIILLQDRRCTFSFLFSEIEISLYYLLSMFYLQFISISATIQNMQIYRVSVLFEYEIS